MEVKDTANSRKNREQLDSSIQIIGSFDSHPLHAKILAFKSGLAPFSNSYQIKINYSNNYITLKNKKRLVQLPLNSINISSLLNHIVYQRGQDQLRFQLSQKQDRLRSKLHKKYQQYQRQITKHAETRHKALAGSLKKNLLFSRVTKIQNIPLITLDLAQFKSFQSCQLLIHEKGKPVVKHFLFDAINPIRIGEISIDSFNNAYRQIKQSKNRLFHQKQVLTGCPGILGTFLAKDFNLQSYRILFIISRNDFLPPSIEERDHFELYATQLYSVFSRILIKEKYIDHIHYLKIALRHLRRPIQIYDQYNALLFSTPKNDNAEFNRQNILPLPKKYSLLTNDEHKDVLNTDAYHLQRISLLGELLNTLRHELSNPLFGIKLMADLLSEETLDQECSETLSEISNSCLRCQKIIEDFSYLYQDIEMLCEVDIKKLINETSTLTKSATQQIRRSIKFSGKNNYIYSNPTWISQIIFNLILNSAQALQANPQDRPEIKISVHTAKIVKISVSDNGPGITSNIQKQIFKPFFTTKLKGTGLGLAICSNLANKLGGGISFSDNHDRRGVTFTLWFPSGKN